MGVFVDDFSAIFETGARGDPPGVVVDVGVGTPDRLEPLSVVAKVLLRVVNGRL